MLVLTLRVQLAQQRTAHNELEDQRKQTDELARAKKQLESRLVDLQSQLEREQLAKNEEISKNLFYSSPFLSLMQFAQPPRDYCRANWTIKKSTQPHRPTRPQVN